MTLPRPKRSVMSGVAVLFLLVAILLLSVQMVYAAGSATASLYSISSNADCSSVTVTVKIEHQDIPNTGSGGKFGFSVIDSGGTIGTGGVAYAGYFGTGEFLASATANSGGTSESSVVIDGPGSVGLDGGSIRYHFLATHPCGTTQFFGEGDASGANPIPPTGIWLAYVCEPFDGFSGAKWTTVDSDAASKPWGTKLYVAASADGPWWETEFLQPPYVISQSQMEALAAMVGAATPYDMWLRAGDPGTVANYGSMVEDRNAIMAELCGN